MPENSKWYNKLVAFIKDPLVFIATALLMAPFIAFTVGAYLLDYDSSEYEVVSSARNKIQTLGPWFITFFLLSNLQAAATLIIVLIFVTITILLCGTPICGVVYYKYHNR